MAIDTLKQEEGVVGEGDGVGDADTTRDIISDNELQLFCDSLSNTLQNTANFQYTLGKQFTEFVWCSRKVSYLTSLTCEVLYIFRNKSL